MTNKSMTNFHLIFPFFLFLFFIQQTITQNPPVVPLTNALTTIFCHHSDDVGMMIIRCEANEKIRMLDAFDVVVKNKSHLPYQCLKQQQQHYSFNDRQDSSETDCKIPTSFTSACSGRENCTLHMQRKQLTIPKENCYNELVDYTIAFFECISDVFIHDVCSSQAITSAWGTLKTPNFPNPYTSNDDCWCKLSTQVQQRLLLSVIVFQLIPYDQKCAGAGLYLQSSDEQRSTQCTYLQQGHNYLSDTNSLYINFYSRTSTVRGGFWIIYEASHPNSEVHLHCGSKEKIGVPSTILSDSLPLISSSYNHGWSRLVYNNPQNPPSTTTPVSEHMMRMRLFVSTPRPYLDTNFKIGTSTIAAGAFTYPYGRLTTFELDYGPRGWFLKYLFGSSNMTATRFLQTTTSQSPVVKWNSTWRYIRRLRPRTFTTTTTTTAAVTTIKTTTTTISTTVPTTTTTSTSTTMITSTISTTEQSTISVSSSSVPTITLQSVSAQQPLLNTREPWISYRTRNKKSSTTTTTTIVLSIDSTTHLPTSLFTSQSTLPLPTPWYPPAGLNDWWELQGHTTTPTTTIVTTTTTTTTTTTVTEQSTTTTTTTTVMTTTSTTTQESTTTTTTTENLIISTNNMVTITHPRKNQTTTDWFKWPHHEFTSTIKERPDSYEEEYNDWSDIFTTAVTQFSITTDPLLYIRPDKPRQKFQQLSFLPIKLNEQFNNHSIPNLTLTSKRHSTQPYSNGISERNSIGNQLNGITKTNTETMIQTIIKKSSGETAWLSKTDMKIVGISILFVVLLLLTNLILFTVRRYRRRIQGRHLLSASSINARRNFPNDPMQNSRHSMPINSLINTTNNNNNDILPAVGEIVIWDEKDQGGYTIDNQGEWEKIEGNQWFGNSILKNCSKTSFTKSFRSRFQFIRQSKKKPNYRQPQTPRAPQHGFKYPLLMDTASLSPVPEVDDYRLSQVSSEIANKNPVQTIQALIHKDQEQSDEYYKRIEIAESESIYTLMNENNQGNYSINDQQSDRNNIDQQGSVIISVPTMFRQDDETTYDGDSIYNQNYPTHQSLNTNRIPKINNTIIVGHCQVDFQPLNPKLFLKPPEKSLLADHQQFYSCSQSLQLSAYDSGFFDDQTMNSLATTSTIPFDELEKKNNK